LGFWRMRVKGGREKWVATIGEGIPPPKHSKRTNIPPIECLGGEEARNQGTCKM